MSGYVHVPSRESTLDEIKEYQKKLNKYLKEINWDDYIDIYENNRNLIILNKEINNDNIFKWVDDKDGFSMFTIFLSSKHIKEIIETFKTCNKTKIKTTLRGNTYHYQYTPHDNRFWTYRNNEIYESKSNGISISIKHVAAIIKYLNGTN